MNSQKGFVIPIIIAIVAIFVISIGGYYLFTKPFNNYYFSEEKKDSNISNQIATTTSIIGGDKDIHGCIGSAGYSWCEIKNKCLRIWEEKCEIDKTQSSISSIIPSSGSFGTSVELKGYNILSNRGDQNLMIENSSGEKASLGFGNPTHLNTSENYVSMKFVVPEKVCKKLTTDAALSCTSWMTIVPGEYKIYVVGPTNNYFISNKVNFNVIDSVSVLNGKEITILGYCNWVFANGGILLCSDDSKNTNWEIDYTNAKYYEEGIDSNIQPVILSTNSLFANFDFWLKHIIQISKPGGEDFSGAPGWVKVVGFVEEDNTIHASKIIQHVQ